MLDLDVINSLFENVGTVDNYDSLIWTRKYFEAGEFEIYAPATSNNRSLLIPGNYINKPGATESGQIYAINAADNEAGEKYIKATGRFISNILSRHLIRHNIIFENINAAAAMKKLVDMTVINGETDDTIDILSISTETDNVTATFTGAIKAYTDLYDALVAISYQTGAGFKIAFSDDLTGLVFSCYEAKDVSTGQDVNPQIEFKKEYNNISGSNYTYDQETEVNAVVAEYDGDLGHAMVEVNPDSKTGIAKKEIHITGECVTSKAYRQNDAGEWEQYDVINTTETEKALKTLAYSALIPASESFLADIDLYSKTTAYKKDYDLGDIITVTDETINKTLIARIYEVTETDDSSGHDITAVLGSRYPVTMDILKQ